MRPITLLAFASVLAWADTNADLLSAARAGDLAAVKTAIESGAVLETKTPYGQTPLYLAAMNGHEDVVRFLLDKGAHTDVSDTFYKAPMLGFVIQRKHWGVAKMLVAKPANPDQTLGEVAGAGRADLVETVLTTSKPSQSALDQAYESALEGKKADVAGLLKKAGANDPAPPATVDAAVLASYAGTYKSEQMPLEIKVSIKEGKLYGQATGQGEFPTKTLSATRFAFTAAQLELEFEGADAFTLKQGGQSFKFKKVVSK
jgi:hypothetical protein